MAADKPAPPTIPPTPWRVDPYNIGRVVDANQSPVAHTFPADTCAATAAEVVRLMNTHRPPKDALQSPQTVLALAILGGDPSAAWAAADDVLAHQEQPDGFVSRDELIDFVRRAANTKGDDYRGWHPQDAKECNEWAKQLLARIDAGEHS